MAAKAPTELAEAAEGLTEVAQGPPEPPVGLEVSGQELWRSVLADYDFEQFKLLLLLQACRCADRLDRLAESTGEALVVNTKGDTVPNPALVESRQQSLTLARLLASLRMPSGESDGALVRPQRRGGARGSYGVRGVA